MKYYLLSGMNEKDDYNFYDDVAEILREQIANFETIVYVPANFTSKQKRIKLAKSEKFLNIGINFKNSIVLDYSYTEEQAKEIIKNNNLIFLYGGNPYEQIEFINKYKIKDRIEDKTIIALSAGSINMSKVAICTKDEDFPNSSRYDGMGLIDFSIEPHFDINNKDVIRDLQEYSKETEIYALEDDAFIILDNNEKKLYRKYIFDKKWKYNKNKLNKNKLRVTLVTLNLLFNRN